MELYDEDYEKLDVIKKGKANSWRNFYMKDSWPLILDEYSRFFFPFSFIIFNVIYWVTAVKSSQVLTRIE